MIAASGALRALSVSGEHGCAIDDAGVHCWGGGLGDWPDDGAMHAVELNGATVISVGGLDACALSPRGVECWGATPLDAAERAIDVPSGRHHRRYFAPRVVPGIEGATHVSLGLGRACAIDGDAALVC